MTDRHKHMQPHFMDDLAYISQPTVQMQLLHIWLLNVVQ